jgi:hypothetical protein
VIHLQEDQAEIILLDQNPLELSSELWLVRQGKLNRLEQHDQCGQPLLAIYNLDHGILVSDDRLKTAIEPDDGRHEMPLLRTAPQTANIIKHILALLGAP